jgi:tripartite-type tricarboxylate transporter receptor subunit TctC
MLAHWPSAREDTSLRILKRWGSVQIVLAGTAQPSIQRRGYCNTRLIGQWLSERLGQQFVVENRPGAATNLAAEAVVRSPSDGYTLLGFDVSAAFNATLYDKLNFSFIREIAPVEGIARATQIMTVDPTVPARTVPEFIAYAKANPGKIAMATAGVGSPMHMAGELSKMLSGVDFVHVPYRGVARSTHA